MSGGRDLGIYCGETPHAWHAGSSGFVGGAEEAVIHLARALQRLGWRITVYNNCGAAAVADPEAAGEATGAVSYRPLAEFDPRRRCDVAIVWRQPRYLDLGLRADKLLLDMHEAIPARELTPARLARVTRICVKSRFHRSVYGAVPDDKFAVITNGMDLRPLTSDPAIEKDPYLLINTSSPDRAMDVLPHLFARVRDRVPQARLEWAYGWDMLLALCRNNPRVLAWVERTRTAMDAAGIVSLGYLSQDAVGQLYQRAAIFAYPTEIAEIDCISVKKAQAAGCFPVTTDFAALAETVETGIKIHSPKTKDDWARPYQFHFGLEDETAQQAWVDAVVRALEAGPLPAATRDAMWQNAQKYAWPVIAARWHELMVA